MKTVIFDIETGPASEFEMLLVMPTFSPPANYKDPEKIAQSINEQKAKFMERAALSAVTGRVLAIGYTVVDDETESKDTTVLIEDEAVMMSKFFETIEGQRIIGFNSTNFDMPFLFRRAWARGIKPPVERLGKSKGFLEDPDHIDLMRVWSCGVYGEYESLDMIAKTLGRGSKSGCGRHFHQMLQNNKDEAIKYLLRDLEVTLAVAQAMDLV